MHTGPLAATWHVVLLPVPARLVSTPLPVPSSTKPSATGLQDKVLGCTRVLVDQAVSKVAEGDVVLTYGQSSAVLQLLIKAKQVPCGRAACAMSSVPSHVGAA